MQNQTIGVDFDYAYQIGHRFVSYTMQILQSAGHEVVMVSSQQPSLKVKREVEALNMGLKVIFTHGHSHYNYCAFAGKPIDIWITAYPQAIHQNLPYDPNKANRISPFEGEKLHIGVDFDGTYDADPESFSRICDHAKSQTNLYDARIVTGRYDRLGHPSNIDMKKLLAQYSPNIKTHFTQIQAKIKYLNNLKLSKFQPHIWIDNEPAFIYRSR
jgi:hypothetical protein